MRELLGDSLVRACSNALELVVVAPYIKKDALTRILSKVNSNASLICVTRWFPYDLALGASDAACRNLVTDFGGQFLLHPTLHAKYYRINNTVLIGSANLTSSAMGWTSHPNLEILSGAGDDFDAIGFEKGLLAESREITDSEFQSWVAISEIDQPVGGLPESLHPLISWRPTTRDPRHIQLRYRNRESEIASFDEQDASRVDIDSLRIPLGLTDPELHAWISTSLMSAPFTDSVVGLLGNPDKTASTRVLANVYSLGLTEARRDMENGPELARVFRSRHTC